MKKEDLDYFEFKKKYKHKLASALGDSVQDAKQITTSDYETFKQALMPKSMTSYEKACNFAEKIMPIKPDNKSIPALENAIRISHLNISPTGTLSFAAMGCLLIILAAIVFGFFIPYALTNGAFTGGVFFVIFGVAIALIMFVPFTKLPFIISNVWRMKASNQMVLSIFYVVTYMRHTPNLELAIDFAAEHLSPPLSLDFKKIIWDIETGKFDNVNESMDYYLQGWQEYNQEFIESMHLIQSSLYESSESRRRDALDKSLQVILDETYEKMLHFTHDLKGPITTLHMLGIVLPILGLVILPLLTAFMPEAKWYHLFAIYNIALPVLVYYMGREILSTRPTGYGGIDVANMKPETAENNKIKLKFSQNNDDGIMITPMLGAMFIMIVLLIIGFLPLLIHVANPDFDFVFTEENGFINVVDVDPGNRILVRFLDYRETRDSSGIPNGILGPYGLGANMLSLALPLAFGLSIGLYNKWKTSSLTKVRERTEKLEQEFASALFQLGNRLADGVPAEIAFSSVAKTMKGTQSGKFFEMVTINIVKLGMGVEDAIFDRENGALQHFPSSIIESSMKVFVESSRKGPLIASQAVMTVAEYIKSMHRVDERLKDLMAEIVSSMKSQISFLTPAIAGIVVGITSMISQIIGSLSEKMSEFANSETNVAFASGILGSIGAGGIPTFYFQAIVGVYVVQITYVLTILVSGIQSGSDKISERELLGKNMISSTLLYVAIAGIFTLLFTIIATVITSNIGT
jgi:hypothetical protein